MSKRSRRHFTTELAARPRDRRRRDGGGPHDDRSLPDRAVTARYSIRPLADSLPRRRATS